MTSPTAEERAPVTQADREAAWPWRNKDAYREADKVGWMDGIYDLCPTPIRDFARHRIAHEAAAIERAAKVAEAAALNQYGPTTRGAVSKEIAASIRALAGGEERDG